MSDDEDSMRQHTKSGRKANLDAGRRVNPSERLLVETIGSVNDKPIKVEFIARKLAQAHENVGDVKEMSRRCIEITENAWGFVWRERDRTGADRSSADSVLSDGRCSSTSQDVLSLPFPDARTEEAPGDTPTYETTAPCTEQLAKDATVLKDSVVALGHYGERCPDADLGRTFTLVEKNSIHATAISFCRCQTPNGQRGAPEFQQFLRAGIFPGSVKGPKTGYTLDLLDYYHEQRSQGKGSAYNFVHVLQRMADPFLRTQFQEVDQSDIYANFLAITRFHQHLETIIRRGHAHGLDDPLPGEADRPYPNRPLGYLGVQCAACPERGVNMPPVVNVPKYLRHLISQHLTLDGNFKANLFFKHDDGSDKALTNGRMYFPKQAEFDEIAKAYVVSEEDKEVPCKAYIGSIRHQGSVSFALGTYAQREHLKHANSPPHSPATTTPTVYIYDSWCSFVLNLVNRAVTIFPEEEWLHTLLAEVEGQIPADHINGHGLDCQTIWQAVYFGCRAHFHGATAETIWAFLNPLGSSMRQSTGAARKEIINFVMDARNQWKVLPQLLADERLAALQLFEVHMAVVQEFSMLTIANMLASMIADEREKMTREDEYDPRSSVARWLHDGIGVEHEQILVIALLKSHQEHPLQDTWTTIATLRDSLNLNLKKFRECQREIYPRLKLSALDIDEPELTAIQLPSYRMKHGQQLATGVGANIK
ncbi:hypothetical protein DFH09DRAFT_1090130 [Mycena vulgaris]|nr:hypothetical protein DFH09DRAFT_1090130 [Mycena vulgaris]